MKIKKTIMCTRLHLKNLYYKIIINEIYHVSLYYTYNDKNYF